MRASRLWSHRVLRGTVTCVAAAALKSGSRPFALLRVAIVAMLFAAVMPTLAGAATQTQCTKTLTGVTLGSIVVPVNGACTLKSSFVKGTVTVQRNAYFQATGTNITGAVTGNNLATQRAQTIFIDTGSHTGAVSAGAAAQVYVFNATVNGVSSVGASSQVEVCGTTVRNGIVVEHLKGGGSREVLIGDPAANCGPDTASNVLVEYNSTNSFFGIMGNTISGNMAVSYNSGSSAKDVENNNGGNTLSCIGNVRPFVGTPNGTWASKQGQCH